MSREDYISTSEAAGEPGVPRRRVLQLIQDGRLKAEKFASVYMIRRDDLSDIEEKPMGRPPKARSEAAPSSDGKVFVKKKGATKKGGEKG